jgi:pilus assembly protein CpaF
MASGLGEGLGDAVGVIEQVAGQIASGSVPMRRADVAAEAERRLRLAAPHRAAQLTGAVVDRVLGLGPLEPLLRDPEVTDVLVNGPKEVWVDRRGELSRADASFASNEELLAAVERVIAPLGLRIDRSCPMVDARLPDGSRLHAVTPPASVDHPIVAIRRFSQAVISLEALVSLGTASESQAMTLAAAVRSRKTIIVSGGTGAGKTTLLNLLGSLIPNTERVVTIEDAAELRLPGHVVRLEAHPPNAEGAGEITIRSLLRSALRLRPDRIIVGEVRGPEALDLVWALNTGHRGSLSTVHANSPEEALWRLETLALSAGDTSETTVRRQLHAAVDYIVQIERTGPERRIRALATVGSNGEIGDDL